MLLVMREISINSLPTMQNAVLLPSCGSQAWCIFQQVSVPAFLAVILAGSLFKNNVRVGHDFLKKVLKRGVVMKCGLLLRLSGGKNVSHLKSWLGPENADAAGTVKRYVVLRIKLFMEWK